MPELPEIALFKKYLDATALHKEIVKLSFPDDSLLQAPKSHFEEALKGKKLEETKRLGKYLFIRVSGGNWLVFHFGMTGKLEYYQNQDSPKYTKMLLSFENGYHLSYSCRRKLGRIYLAQGLEEFQKEHSLGPDALELTQKQFLKLLENKGGSVKGALTDQHLLSGIGNVYADEMLYHSGIHPKTKTDKISEAEKKDLYKKMKEVLKMAIKKDGERSDFPSDYLISHRKEGEDCPKCDGKIKKIKVAGRSTYFCPACQKEEK